MRRGKRRGRVGGEEIDEREGGEGGSKDGEGEYDAGR